MCLLPCFWLCYLQTQDDALATVKFLKISWRNWKPTLWDVRPKLLMTHPVWRKGEGLSINDSLKRNTILNFFCWRRTWVRLFSHDLVAEIMFESVSNNYEWHLPFYLSQNFLYTLSMQVHDGWKWHEKTAFHQGMACSKVFPGGHAGYTALL